MILPTADSRSVTPGIKLVGGKMQIFVINLPRATERRMFQEEQFKRLSLKFHLLEATCVNKISDETYQKHYRDWQRPLRKTEVACYYSHRFAWKKVIETGKPALILEDDALLSRRVPGLLINLKNTTDIDLINFEVRGRKKYVSKTGESVPPDSRLLRLHQDRCGAAGYILWPAGAQKLLEAEKKKGIALADAHITDCHELLAYQIEPAAIIQLDQCSHYGIQVAEAENISLTSISTSASSQGGASFRVKRIYSQLKLGIRQLLLMSKARKRHIDLVTEDFSHG